jgi:hypothetical protein
MWVIVRVPTWVPSSTVLPLALVKKTGTLPSLVTVKM